MVDTITCSDFTENEFKQAILIKKSKDEKYLILNYLNGSFVYVKSETKTEEENEFKIPIKTCETLLFEIVSCKIFYSSNKSNIICMKEIQKSTEPIKVMKFSASVSSIYYNENDATIIGASFDFSIKSYNINTGYTKTLLCLQAPILTISLLSKIGMMVFLSYDGLLHIGYDKIINKINLSYNYNLKIYNNHYMFMSIDMTETVIAVCCVQSIKFVCTDTFTIIREHKVTNMPGPFSIVFDQNILIFPNNTKFGQISMYDHHTQCKINIDLGKKFNISSMALKDSSLYLTSDNSMICVKDIELARTCISNSLVEMDFSDNIVVPKKRKLAVEIDDEFRSESNDNLIDSFTTDVKCLSNSSISLISQALTKNKSDNYYLTWNAVGTVGVYSSFDGKSVVKIQFHDASHHSSILIQNLDDFCLSDLSYTNICLATHSKIYCVCFLLNKDTDWTKSFQPEKKILNLCCSDKIIAIAFFQNISIFSITGFHMSDISLAGSIFYLIAKAENILSLEILSSQDNNGISTQNIICQHIQLHRLSPVKIGRSYLIIPKSISIIWAGFTSDNRYAVVDSARTLHLAYRFPSGNEYFWESLEITSYPNLSFENSSVHSIDIDRKICNLVAGSPDVSKYPTPNEGGLHQILTLPIIINGESSQNAVDLLEAELRMSRILNHSCFLNSDKYEYDLKTTEYLFKIFAICCKNNNEVKAYDVACIMHNPSLIEKCILYAASLNLYSLIKILKQI